MATTPAVFIVDQDPDARFQAGRVVQDVEFSLGGESGAGTEAVALASDSRPDILLVGIKEPLTRAVQTIESLVYALPHTPVIAYAETDDLETIRRAMLAGARDFLRAPFKTGELKRSLIAALESEERRRLREAGEATIGPRAVSIAVFGAKGGIGKTTVAANLGVALARAGQSTVLVDLDDTFGDAAASLDLSPEQTVADALRAAESEAEGVAGEGALEAAVHHGSGLRVIAAPASPLEWTDVRGERVGRLLHQLASKVDVLIADTASSLSERTLAILEASSIVLWVTTPDYPSVRDSLQAMQALTRLDLIPEERVRLILNVSSPDLEVRPASVEEALGTSIFWTLPYDSRLRRSGQLGQAFVVSSPSSAWSMSVTELGRILTGGQQTAPSQSRSVRGWLGGLKIGSWRRNTPEVRAEVRP